MKNARIIMAMLVLLGAASLAEAQIVVSSTTASTVRQRPKSGREKGWVIRPEIELGTGDYGGYLGISGAACYQFNPYFSIGGGFGGLIDFYSSGSDSKPVSLPIFANARVYFIDRKWSPFLDLKFGYMIPLMSGAEHSYYDGYSNFYHYDGTDTMQGLVFGPTLGVQVKGFDFGIGVKWFNVYHTEERHEHSEYSGDSDFYESENRHLGYIGVSVAYNFQLKKK